MMTNKPDLAQVIKQFGKAFLEQHSSSVLQKKVLRNISQCRTAVLGGHEEACDCCGQIRYSYNSCNDRHCPKCQAAKQAVWVDNLKESTLPIKHYHIIFTIPHVLNKVCLYNNKLFYKILFSAVWRTLHSFGYTHFGTETGAICVLHSWGQNLSLHPHLHCIVPAAGSSLMGKWKTIGTNENYLYPVHELSATFKGKFLDSLKRGLKKAGVLANFDSLIQKAYSKKWVVFCESSLANTDHVIRYLGQYTHKVAITNQRILKITDTHVTFIAKDYRDNACQKPVTLTGVEFLRRFCLHILPYRFVKIRRFGIYNHTSQRAMEIQLLPDQKPDILEKEKNPIKETTPERLFRLTGFDIQQCPACKNGRMKVVKIIPRIRSPNMGNLNAFGFTRA